MSTPDTKPTLKLYRPRHQRGRRLLPVPPLLAPAVVLPMMFPGEASILFLAIGLVVIVVIRVTDALGPVARVSADGIGIRGNLGTGTIWLAWCEIREIEPSMGVLSVTTRGRSMYQLHLDADSTRSLLNSAASHGEFGPSR